MTATPDSRARLSSATWCGLFLAIFGMLIVRQAVLFYWPNPTFISAVWKESLIWICAIALLVIIRRGEHLPFSSVGLGTSPLWKSILWGLALMVVCGLVAVVIVHLTHYDGGANAAALSRLPKWMITLVVLRAGVVEELFYRGYAIERLEAWGLHRYWAAAIPLVAFSIAHWTGGWQNIVIALALGAILAGFYLWRRDLVANMIGHFLVDFVPNVLLPALPDGK